MSTAESNPSTYMRIATEEAYAPPELLDEYRRMLREGSGDLGFESLWGYYLNNPSEHTRSLVTRIQDLGERRLSDLQDLRIDHQVLGLTCPGVELLDVSPARELVTLANDRIADACDAHPDKFSGLAGLALKDVDFSIRELERAVGRGLRGAIVNSHADGCYLDDPRFLPLFEALERLDVPLYLHPNTPSDRMIGPMLDSGLDGAIYGFGVETGMHLLRIIFAGVFDRYPRLRLVVGHLGEALPFWQYRVDHFHAVQARSGRYPQRPELELRPSEYMRRNIWITTSGMPWEPAIMFTRQIVGHDRVMYAMDYPYQASVAELEAQERLPIPDDQKAALFETTATHVFGLNVSSALPVP